MNLIATITEEDLGRNSNPEEWKSFEDRSAARAMLIDDNSRIALLCT